MMWFPKTKAKQKEGNGLVAVAINKDKGSRQAIKWAIENLVKKGQSIVLIHVIQRATNVSSSGNATILSDLGDEPESSHKKQLEKQTKSLFLTFRCFCTRKDISCIEVVLEDSDVAKALIDYVTYAAIQNLVLGAPSRHGFIRLRTSSTPSSVSKAVPDFCSVYVISKEKISSVRNASRPAPSSSPLLEQIVKNNQNDNPPETPSKLRRSMIERAAYRHPNLGDDTARSEYGPGGRILCLKDWELSESDTDISFVSSGRPSIDVLSLSSGRPSTDCSSYGRPSTDYLLYGRPSTDSLLYGRPSTDYSSYGRPSTDCSSYGRPSIDVSSYGRPSVDRSNYIYECLDGPRVSISTQKSFGPINPGGKLSEVSSLNDLTTLSPSSGKTSCSSPSQNMGGAESEMRRLQLELKQTMEMYSNACKEAISAKQKAMELHKWRLEEEKKSEEARLAKEAALSVAEIEKAKCRTAIEEAEAAKRIADIQAEKRMEVENEGLEGTDGVENRINYLPQIRYRKYSIDEIEAATEFFNVSRKIGEGGYGPVFKCYIDHTPAAVKLLRPDANQGRLQFQQEVEILSCIRHPNVVLLLGACPEYGCLVYEHMAKGSLDDHLLKRKNTPAISWQVRFRIAAEIATGLLFLHQTKPEPIVHRDLKPANILLDKNYVAKIGDVGLARLVPAVAENVTQCHMTSTAGTFCYIDPEYQQTGMLGVKSDLYAFGIMLLQILTAKPAMGLTHLVERSIENGTFAEMLDPAVPDWPIEEALCVAELGLQCAQLRRKDRPDLGKGVMPELNRLRQLADDNIDEVIFCGSTGPSPNNSQDSFTQERERQHFY